MKREMIALGSITAAAALLLQVGYTQSPPAPATDNVGFPANYQTAMQVLYVFDRPDLKQVRTVYANSQAVQIKYDEDYKYPYGSVLVMENWRALQDADGNPILDANGRYQKDPAAAPTIFAMRKEAGYGAPYGPNRTGEWEYVAYRPDGTYQTTPQNSFSCAQCHRQSNATRDWTFRTSQTFFEGSGATVDATIRNYKFVPGELHVKSGSFVTFYNDDVVEHNIVDAVAGGSDSGRLHAGRTITYRFDTPGEFNFRCTLHQNMRGKVVVE